MPVIRHMYTKIVHGFYTLLKDKRRKSGITLDFLTTPSAHLKTFGLNPNYCNYCEFMSVRLGKNSQVRDIYLVAKALILDTGTLFF